MHVEIDYTVFLALVIVGLLWFLFRNVDNKKANEAELLEDLVKKYNYWMEKGEEEYAAAYKLLINKFSQIPDSQ